MFRGAGSGGEGVGAMKIREWGQGMFRCAGKVCIGAGAAFFSLII